MPRWALPIALAYEARLESCQLLNHVLRRHELQVWFLAEHLVDTPAVRVALG